MCQDGLNHDLILPFQSNPPFVPRDNKSLFSFRPFLGGFDAQIYQFMLLEPSHTKELSSPLALDGSRVERDCSGQLRLCSCTRTGRIWSLQTLGCAWSPGNLSPVTASLSQAGLKAQEMGLEWEKLIRASQALGLCFESWPYFWRQNPATDRAKSNSCLGTAPELCRQQVQGVTWLALEELGVDI